MYVETHVLAARCSLTLALISILIPAAPCLWAQADQWENNMKSGHKAYSDGMSQKYFHGWGDAGPNPEFAKAEKEYLAALAQTQSFPSGDTRTAETLGALATVYMEEGRYADAESNGNRAIAIIAAAVKPDDRRLGNDLTHLALIYDSENKTEQAAPLWERSLGIMKNSGGADPQLISYLEVHASIAHYGRAATAQIYQYILDLKESTGISDTDLRNLLEQLARNQLGTDAERDYLRLLDVDKRLYGPDDVRTGADQETLANLYLNEGKYTSALPLLEHNLEIMQTKPAPEHESRLSKRFDASDLNRLDTMLAQAYAGAGKDAEAEEMYKRVISMEEADATHGKVSNDMDLSGDFTGLSGVYRHEHRYDEALETIKRSEAVDDELTNSKYGKSKENSNALGVSVFSWLSQIELAEIYREKGDSAAAEPLFQRSLEMTQSMHLAPGHPKLAQMLDNYATLLRDAGKYDQAEALYKRSLETWAKCVYPENADAAETLTNYAVLLRKVNRPAEAEPLEARASAMLAKVGPSSTAK
jgi:tetratricopeptide (TPR) repeat protein